MRKVIALAALLAAVATAVLIAAVKGPGPDEGVASSHREAPLISEDPAADLTDVYAFRSPDKPDTVTIIANVLPGEDPGAGPNYYTFSPNARYNLKIDTSGDVSPDVIYRFQFQRKTGQFFLGDTAQPFTVTRQQGGKTTVVARGTTAPNNIGPRSTPNYPSLAQKSILSFDGGRSKVFAGQRDDGFFGDVGAIFDLVAIRKGTGNAGGGRDFFAGYNVHAIALQIPIATLDDTDHTIGIWSTVDRQQLTLRNVTRSVKVRVKVGKRTVTRTVKVRQAVSSMQWVQVSRLGNPLVNEVVIPTARKDEWNGDTPDEESKYETFYTNPILAAVINTVYPGLIKAPENNRDDLVAVLLTGVPGLNNTGTAKVEMLRLNMSIAPKGPVGTGNRLGVFGADNAGWPNGRRR